MNRFDQCSANIVNDTQNNQSPKEKEKHVINIKTRQRLLELKKECQATELSQKQEIPLSLLEYTQKPLSNSAHPGKQGLDRAWDIVS